MFPEEEEEEGKENEEEVKEEEKEEEGGEEEEEIKYPKTNPPSSKLRRPLLWRFAPISPTRLKTSELKTLECYHLHQKHS